jgi:hypothetical protein
MFVRLNNFLENAKLRRSLKIGFSVRVVKDAREEFSSRHYASAYPELALSNELDCWAHFLDRGWREGKDPSPHFSTNEYLAIHQDVAEAGVNPFLHFIAYGRSEGRQRRQHPTFCVVPFLEANVMPTGAVRPCCAFHGSIMENGRRMSVYEHTVEEIWNSSDLRAIRKNMVEGKPVFQCWYCSSSEERGEPSMRTDLNKGWEIAGYGNPRNETIKQLKSTAIANDFYMSRGPAWVDLELGNLCNLKCRMCSSTWSSSIATDPVQSRWATYDIEAPARWQGREMLVAPKRALGFEYEGLQKIDWSAETPVAWMQVGLSVLMKTGGRLVTAVRLRLCAGEDPQCPVEVFINRELVFRGKLYKGAIDQTIQLPKDRLDVDEFLFQIRCNTRVGIEEVNFLRPETGKSTVGLSRFASGKQWCQDEKFLIEDLLYKTEDIAKLHMVAESLSS